MLVCRVRRIAWARIDWARIAWSLVAMTLPVACASAPPGATRAPEPGAERADPKGIAQVWVPAGSFTMAATKPPCASSGRSTRRAGFSASCPASSPRTWSA